MKKLITFFVLFLCFSTSLGQNIPAFPNAEGFGAKTAGGRGGKVIYVTNLRCSGEGSLTNALLQKGKKYILFKVSGVIPCAAEVQQGDAYIAGQTSPNGITVRGLIFDKIYETGWKSDNVIVRHLRSRPNAEINLPNQGYILDDALRLDGADNVIIDHCSFANAADETVQISHSQNITIQNSMLAETIGEHFNLGGMLINYSRPNHILDNISVHHNVFNRLGGRMPEIGCEGGNCSGLIINFEFSSNLLWDQQIQTWYNPCSEVNSGNSCQDVNLNLNFTNNYSYVRNSYTGPMVSADFLQNRRNRIYATGNKMNIYPQFSDYQLFFCCNDFNENLPNSDNGTAQLLSTRHNFPGIAATPVNNLINYSLSTVGAFPRDAMDIRLLMPLAKNKIDEKPINGTDFYKDAFKTTTERSAAPTDSDNDGMPDDWEKMNGLNPKLADHNGTQLSKKFTGIDGYSNLECYLNELSDKLTAVKYF